MSISKVNMYLCFSLLSLLCSLKSVVYAHDQSDRPLVFCTVEWPPYTVVRSKDNSIGGLHTEMITEIFSRVGRAVEFKKMPWKRCFKMAQMNKVDGIYSASFKPERAKVVNYPENPLEEIGYVFATLEDPSMFEWNDEKNLKNLPQPIGSPLGFSVTSELKEAGVDVDDNAVNDKINFEKLLKGRVKSIVIIESALKAFIQKLKKDGSRVKVYTLNPAYIAGKPYYITVSKKIDGSVEKSKELVQSINEAIGSMYADGFIKTLQEEYFSRS